MHIAHILYLTILSLWTLRPRNWGNVGGDMTSRSDVVNIDHKDQSFQRVGV